MSRKALLLILLLSLTLVACGGDEAPASEADTPPAIEQVDEGDGVEEADAIEEVEAIEEGETVEEIEDPEAVVVVEPPLVAGDLPLGEPTLAEGQGFRYRPIVAYETEVSSGAVTFVAPGASDVAGPAFFLAGGSAESFGVAGAPTDEDEAQALFGTYLGTLVPAEGSQIEQPRRIAVNQVPGYDVSFAVFGEEPRRGRITLLQPEGDQLFVMVGQAPPDLWPAYEELYANVLRGVEIVGE